MWAPFKKVPNTYGMKLGDSNLDPLLYEIGILKKEPRSKEFQRGPNGHLEKYAKAQIIRFRTLVKNGDLEKA